MNKRKLLILFMMVTTIMLSVFALAVPLVSASGASCEHKSYYMQKDDTHHWRHCRNCGTNFKKTKHTFNRTGALKSEGTCTKRSVYYVYCNCGAESTKEGSLAGHTYSSWSVGRKATCTENGYEYRMCMKCDGAYEERTLNKLGHTGGKLGEYSDGEYHYKLCKRVNNGKVCNEPYDGEPHTFGKYISVDGTWHKRVCSLGSCGYEEETKHQDFEFKYESVPSNYKQHKVICGACNELWAWEDHDDWSCGSEVKDGAHKCGTCSFTSKSIGTTDGFTYYPYHTYDFDSYGNGYVINGKNYKCDFCDKTTLTVTPPNMDYLDKEYYAASDAEVEMPEVPYFAPGTYYYTLSDKPRDLQGNVISSNQLVIAPEQVKLTSWRQGNVKEHAKEYVKNCTERIEEIEKGLKSGTGDYVSDPLDAEEAMMWIEDEKNAVGSNDPWIDDPVIRFAENKLDDWVPLSQVEAFISSDLTEEPTQSYAAGDLKIAVTYNHGKGGWYMNNLFYPSPSHMYTQLIQNGGYESSKPEPIIANIYYCYRTTDNKMPICNTLPDENGEVHEIRPFEYMYKHSSVVIYNDGNKGNVSVTVKPDMDLINETGYRFVGNKTKVGAMSVIKPLSYGNGSGVSSSASPSVTVGFSSGKTAAVVTFYVEPVELSYGHQRIDYKGNKTDIIASSHTGTGIKFPNCYDKSLGKCIFPVTSLNKGWWPGYILQSAETKEVNENNKIGKTLWERKYSDSETTNWETGKWEIEEKVPSYYDSENPGYASDKQFYFIYSTPIIEIEHQDYDTKSILYDKNEKPLAYTQQILNEYAYIDSLVTDNVGIPHSLSVNLASGGIQTFSYGLPNYDLVQIEIYEVMSNGKPNAHAILYNDDEYNKATVSGFRNNQIHKIKDYSGVFAKYYSDSLNGIALETGSSELKNTNKNWKIVFKYRQIERVYIRFMDLKGNSIFIPNPNKPGSYMGEITTKIPKDTGYTHLVQDFGENSKFLAVSYTEDKNGYVKDYKNAKNIASGDSIHVPGNSGNRYIVVFYSTDKILKVEYRNIENEQTIKDPISIPIPLSGTTISVPTIPMYEIVGYKHDKDYDGKSTTIAEAIRPLLPTETQIAVPNPDDKEQHIIIYYKANETLKVEYRDIDGDKPLMVPPEYTKSETLIEIPEAGVEITVPVIPGYEVKYYVYNSNYNGMDVSIPGKQNKLTKDDTSLSIASNGNNQFIIIYYEKIKGPTTKLTIEYREGSPDGKKLKEDPIVLEIPNGVETPIGIPTFPGYTVDYYVESGDNTPKDITPENTTITVVGDSKTGDQKIIIVYQPDVKTKVTVEYRDTEGNEIRASVVIELINGQNTPIGIPEIPEYTPKYYEKNGEDPIDITSDLPSIIVVGDPTTGDQKVIIVYNKNVPTIITTEDNKEKVILRANKVGNEEYDVERAIPTSEDLYVSGEVYGYRFVTKMEPVSITETVTVQIHQPYYTDLDGEKEFSKLPTIMVETTVPLKYNYYNVISGELYDLKAVNIENEAIHYFNGYNYNTDKYELYTDKKITLPVNKPVPTFEYELPVGIGQSSKDRVQIVGNSSYTVNYSNGKYIIKVNDADYYEAPNKAYIQEQLKQEAKSILEKCTKIKVQTLKIKQDGAEDLVILTGNTYNLPERDIMLPAGEMELASNDLYIPYLPGRAPMYKFFEENNIYIKKSALNTRYGTTAKGDYRLIETLVGESVDKLKWSEGPTSNRANGSKYYTKSAEFEDIVVNPIFIHTPILNAAKSDITGSKEEIQVSKNIKDSISLKDRVTVLDKELIINVSNEGQHLNEQGYGDRSYNSRGLDVQDENDNLIMLKTGDYITAELNNMILNSGDVFKKSDGTYKYEGPMNEMVAPAFAEHKYVKFPFDVYLTSYSNKVHSYGIKIENGIAVGSGDESEDAEDDSLLGTTISKLVLISEAEVDAKLVKPILLRANEWYDLNDLLNATSDEYKFKIPVWVEDSKLYEGVNGIQVLMVAENCPPIELAKAINNCMSVTSVDANINNKENTYILRKTINIYVAGKLYDLQVRDTDDPGYMNKLKEALNVSKLPLAQKGQVPAYNMGLKLGYRFYFDLKTKGLANKTVEIKPKIYYVSLDGSVVTDNISLFYHSKGSMYNKLTEQDLTVNMALATTHGTINNKGYIAETAAARQLVPTRNLAVSNSIGKLIGGLVLKDTTQKLPYDNVQEETTAIGFSSSGDFVSSAAVSESVPDMSNNNYVAAMNYIRNATGHWYGEYYLPSTTIVVNGVNADKEAASKIVNQKTTGYLVVTFEDIITKDTNGKEYLRYDAETVAGKSQWEKEGAHQNVLLPNGKTVTIPTEGSAMAIYQVGLRANNDFETEGTH